MRESLPSHGSSISYAPLVGRAATNANCRDFTIHAWSCHVNHSTRGRTSQGHRPADIRSLPLRQFAKLSHNATPVGSLHPFGLGISTLWWPYPPDYRTAFAFSDIPYLLCLPPPLQSGYYSSTECGHIGLTYGCRLSALTAAEMHSGQGLRSVGWDSAPGGDFGCCCLRLSSDSLPHIAILVTPCHPLWPLPTHGMFIPSHTFNRSAELTPKPSGASLGRPRLEANRLWPLSPGRG